MPWRHVTSVEEEKKNYYGRSRNHVLRKKKSQLVLRKKSYDGRPLIHVLRKKDGGLGTLWDETQ